MPELREAARDGRYAVTFRDTVMAFTVPWRQRRAHRSQSQSRSSGRAPRHAAPARVRHRHGCGGYREGGTHVLHAFGARECGTFSFAQWNTSSRGMNKPALITMGSGLRVRRRAFIIGTLMVPVLLGLGVAWGAAGKCRDGGKQSLSRADPGMITFWTTHARRTCPFARMLPEREQLECLLRMRPVRRRIFAFRFHLHGLVER